MAFVPALPVPVSVARARFIPVVGDSMAPTLDRGHMVAVVPVETYRGPGLYVHEFLGKPDVWRCQAVPGQGATIRMWKDNPAYGSCTVTLEQFESSLIGQVAAVLRIVDRTLLEDV
jgi:phage repressor protein C with HTH and peptisase S24 domain